MKLHFCLLSFQLFLAGSHSEAGSAGAERNDEQRKLHKINRPHRHYEIGGGPQKGYSKPTPKPVHKPTPEPVYKPTPKPTPKPVPTPVHKPTPYPVPRPTPLPTPHPTERPTPLPTNRPTPDPTPYPTYPATPYPTYKAYNDPYQDPYNDPYQDPYNDPYQDPYLRQDIYMNTPRPTPLPTPNPTPEPTFHPTPHPTTASPSAPPSAEPTTVESTRDRNNDFTLANFICDKENELVLGNLCALIFASPAIFGILDDSPFVDFSELEDVPGFDRFFALQKQSITTPEFPAAGGNRDLQAIFGRLTAFLPNNEAINKLVIRSVKSLFDAFDPVVRNFFQGISLDIDDEETILNDFILGPDGRLCRNEILLSHIHPVEISFDELVCERKIDMLNGEATKTDCSSSRRDLQTGLTASDFPAAGVGPSNTLPIALSTKFQVGVLNTSIDRPKIIDPDNFVSNGVGHIVNGVILPFLENSLLLDVLEDPPRFRTADPIILPFVDIPSRTPSQSPTESEEPSQTPTISEEPSEAPSESMEPSENPTETAEPSDSPPTADESTAEPTATPTDAPSAPPSDEPSATPSASDEPSATPSATPTDAPTTKPTGTPTAAPTKNPTGTPTAAPTNNPTGTPTTFQPISL